MTKPATKLSAKALRQAEFNYALYSAFNLHMFEGKYYRAVNLTIQVKKNGIWFDDFTISPTFESIYFQDNLISSSQLTEALHKPYRLRFTYTRIHANLGPNFTQSFTQDSPNLIRIFPGYTEQKLKIIPYHPGLCLHLPGLRHFCSSYHDALTTTR